MSARVLDLKAGSRCSGREHPKVGRGLRKGLTGWPGRWDVETYPAERDRPEHLPHAWVRHMELPKFKKVLDGARDIFFNIFYHIGVPLRSTAFSRSAKSGVQMLGCSSARRGWESCGCHR